jgi:hypothetical protein
MLHGSEYASSSLYVLKRWRVKERRRERNYNIAKGFRHKEKKNKAGSRVKV